MSQRNSNATHFSGTYDSFVERSLSHRFFTYADIAGLIKAFEKDSLFSVREAGLSAEGRNLRIISCGSGTVPVFLWTQMHGDEPTATMAVFDILNYLQRGTGDPQRNTILQKCRLHFFPMVNPDGAERITRRNAGGIDINRDAAALQTPEAKALMAAFLQIKPAYAFNLHDQSTRYACGNSRRQAALSFLAPAYNEEKAISPNRLNAMKLISLMTEALSGILPGHMAKYDDEYEPRAFGDTFQKSGASTILIESGGKPGDPEKQYIRKLNYIALLTSLTAIAEADTALLQADGYNNLPFNKRSLFDLLLHDVKVPAGSGTASVSIGINLNEIPDPVHRRFTVSATVEDTGDLAGYYGLEELNCEGLYLLPGKTINRDAWDGSTLPPGALFIQGLPAGGSNEPGYQVLAPVYDGANFAPGIAASFILADEKGKPVYYIANGTLSDAAHGIGSPRAGIIVR